MVKCDIIGCGKEMAKTRTDGYLYENLGTRRAYYICTECELKLFGIKR